MELFAVKTKKIIWIIVMILLVGSVNAGFTDWLNSFFDSITGTNTITGMATGLNCDYFIKDTGCPCSYDNECFGYDFDPSNGFCNDHNICDALFPLPGVVFCAGLNNEYDENSKRCIASDNCVNKVRITGTQLDRCYDCEEEIDCAFLEGSTSNYLCNSQGKCELEVVLKPPGEITEEFGVKFTSPEPFKINEENEYFSWEYVPEAGKENWDIYYLFTLECDDGTNAKLTFSDAYSSFGYKTLYSDYMFSSDWVEDDLPVGTPTTCTVGVYVYGLDPNKGYYELMERLVDDEPVKTEHVKTNVVLNIPKQIVSREEPTGGEPPVEPPTGLTGELTEDLKNAGSGIKEGCADSLLNNDLFQSVDSSLMGKIFSENTPICVDSSDGSLNPFSTCVCSLEQGENSCGCTSMDYEISYCSGAHPRDLLNKFTGTDLKVLLPVKESCSLSTIDAGVGEVIRGWFTSQGPALAAVGDDIDYYIKLSFRYYNEGSSEGPTQKRVATTKANNIFEIIPPTTMESLIIKELRDKDILNKLEGNYLYPDIIKNEKKSFELYKEAGKWKVIQMIPGSAVVNIVDPNSFKVDVVSAYPRQHIVTLREKISDFCKHWADLWHFEFESNYQDKWICTYNYCTRRNEWLLTTLGFELN